MVIHEFIVDLAQSTAQNRGTGATNAHRLGDESLLDADRKQEPILSVVMPTHNEEDGIAECTSHGSTTPPGAPDIRRDYQRTPQFQMRTPMCARSPARRTRV